MPSTFCIDCVYDTVWQHLTFSDSLHINIRVQGCLDSCDICVTDWHFPSVLHRGGLQDSHSLGEEECVFFASTPFGTLLLGCISYPALNSPRVSSHNIYSIFTVLVFNFPPAADLSIQPNWEKTGLLHVMFCSTVDWKKDTHRCQDIPHTYVLISIKLKMFVKKTYWCFLTVGSVIASVMPFPVYAVMQFFKLGL